MITFKSLISHRKLGGKKECEWGFSRQWSEDKDMLAEPCTAENGGVQMKINIGKRRAAHLAGTLVS